MNDLLTLLQEFHRDKLADLTRHIEGARSVGQYDANNTYQYIVNREDVQLSWLSSAIAELGGTLQAEAPVDGGAERRAAGRGAAVVKSLIEEDVRQAGAFVDRWRPRVEALTNARQQGMLRVILGETLEQKRFFEQALAGRTDLLGRRGDAVGELVGSVMDTRWVE